MLVTEPYGRKLFALCQDSFADVLKGTDSFSATDRKTRRAWVRLDEAIRKQSLSAGSAASP